ncbi:sensor histidine kinase [Natronolimnohabitans innermongolicus]|uniref:histidine kinase n=1 Tax=Natronolimnohabitans innermongolicus JCM 12255 TaxID=1227499 RepID=L9WPA6_9EURY|nr:histidine kinase N-terminal 7TM domain-containing protein [Natronolimnohabitans innermongolicus]ELY50178.1 HTR-like protein [Natronolimnohabitans innermongolicus JCM 12255]
MTQEFTTVHALTLVLIGLLNFALAVVVLRSRSKTDIVPLSAFFGGIALWTIPQGFLLLESDPTIGFVLAKTVDSGAVIMSTGLFHFALSYAGRRDWLSPRRLGTLYFITAGWVVLTWTNPAHGLMHDPTSFTEVLLPVEAYQNSVYWLYVLYNWGLSAGGIYLFFFEYLDARGSGVYHKQARLVVLAPLIPGLANVLAHNQITEINYSVWGFGLTGLLIVIALYRYRWLDLVPIARDTVIDGMRDGYVVVDDERRIVDLNAAAQSFLNAENALGTPIGDVLPECSSLFVGTENELTFDRNGAIVDARVSDISDERADGVVLMLRDVTDQRRAEKRFQALIENVSDVITVVDQDGTITYTSPSITSVLGYRPDGRIGESLFELIDAEDRAEAIDEFHALCDGPNSETRFEYRVRHADGSLVALEGVAVDLLDNDIVDGVVINSRDVTARNDRERELERTNQRLEEFAGVISHDLRTPLSIAQTYLRFAETSSGPEDFQAVRDAHNRMERMITNLLTMAQTGTTLTDPSPIALESVVADAWDMTQRADATLECTLDDGWTVVGDRAQLLHVFENLFHNSLEHGPSDDRNGTQAADAAGDERCAVSPDCGDSSITIRVSHLDDDPDCGFVVEDDGVGIPDEQREFVFERGHTTSRDGTGFGLAIVHDVIEAHGWQIDVSEGTDGGARFEISTERCGSPAQPQRIPE